MAGTTYVSIQTLDYDDYPVGMETKIGPFDSVEAAEAWLEKSPAFRKIQYSDTYHEWRRVNRGNSNESVRVKDLIDVYMTHPDQFKG